MRGDRSMLRSRLSPIAITHSSTEGSFLGDFVRLAAPETLHES